MICWRLHSVEQHVSSLPVGQVPGEAGVRDWIEEIDWRLVGVGCGCATSVLCLVVLALIVILIGYMLFGIRPIP